MRRIPEEEVKNAMYRMSEDYFRGAYSIAKDLKPFKGKPLWFFISQITGHGSNHSVLICIELVWNPDMIVGEPLPE